MVSKGSCYYNDASTRPCQQGPRRESHEFRPPYRQETRKQNFSNQGLVTRKELIATHYLVWRGMRLSNASRQLGRVDCNQTTLAAPYCGCASAADHCTRWTVTPTEYTHLLLEDGHRDESPHALPETQLTFAHPLTEYSNYVSLATSATVPAKCILSSALSCTASSYKPSLLVVQRKLMLITRFAIMKQ